MSEATGTVLANTTNGQPTTPPGEQKPGLKDRLTAKWHGFEAKHPKLVRTAKWIGRGAAGAGLFFLGRKTAKPVYVTVTPIQPEAEPEETPEEVPSEEPAVTEEN